MEKSVLFLFEPPHSDLGSILQARQSKEAVV